MNNPYTSIPSNQPNRDQLIRVLEHIRETEPETYERNVRECGEKIPAPKDDTDVVGGAYWYSYYPDTINVWSDRLICVFRIKTRKPCNSPD